jgi:hypothetical protein
MFRNNTDRNACVQENPDKHTGVRNHCCQKQRCPEKTLTEMHVSGNNTDRNTRVLEPYLKKNSYPGILLIQK